MSDEKQETVAGIVAEIRGNAEFNHALVEVSKYLNEIADRIETAHKRFYDKYKEHTNELNRQILVLIREREEAARKESSHVGNAAKMREALKRVHKLLGTMDLRYEVSYQIVKKALAAPPMNCDAFSKDKVLEILKDRSFSKEDTIEWLFGEAKGDS